MLSTMVKGLGKDRYPPRYPLNSITSIVLFRQGLLGSDKITNMFSVNYWASLMKTLLALEAEKIIGGAPSFPPGRPTRLNLIQAQDAGQIDTNYIR